MSIFYTNKTITMNRGDSGVVLLSILNRDDTPFALPIGMKNPTIVFSVKAETDVNDLNSNMLIEEYLPIKDYTYYGYGAPDESGQMKIHGGFYPKSKTVNTEESVLDTGIIYKVLANKKYMFVVPTTTPPVYPVSLTKREYAFAVPLVFEPAFTDRLSPGTYTYSITLLDSTSPVQLTQGEGDNITTVDNYSEFLANVTLKQDLFGSQKLILSDSPIARVHGDPIRRIYNIKPCSEESVVNATASEITTGNITNIALPPVYIATNEQLGGIIVGETLQVDFRGVLNVSEEITNKIADLYAKIGDMTTLTTDEKTTLVGAINEVDVHTDANKAEIGDLSGLTTDEKATLVGAINEVDSHANTGISKADAAQATADNATVLANTGISKADAAQVTADNAQQDAETAQATADNATVLANTGISKADRAQSTANTAVDKANDAKATAQEAIMKADGRSTSIGFMTAKDAVTALNGYPRTQLKGGDTIWIVEDGTPDLWVTDVAQESVHYNYTTKDKFNQDLVDNKVLQIGYFKTAYQESDGKPVTIAWQNVVVKNWVASTEFADFPYEAKIELTDFVDYTTVPQVVFDIADTMSGNYAPICKSGDKCVYIYGKVQDEITLKTVITFAPNVNGASVTGGGYNNRGKWVASTTYEIDDLVYTDNGQYVCIEGITSTTSPEQDTTHWQATFVANVPVTSVNGQTGAVTIDVPTKTSDLTNDSNFATTSDIPTKTSQLQNDSNFATTADIPAKTSQLENDSGFITSSDIPTIPTKTSELTNDSGFAKTTEANTFTGVQTFSNADGIKTDRVHNLENNDAWYNFDGSNNRFGSPSRPTIIRTSEARPRAQVPSGETTVTKEIALLEDIANALYPVGSIYMSVNNTNPSTFFGGTWEAWGAGKVPVGVDTNDTNFATVEKTGGEKQHTLTIAEMPAHNHTIPCTPTANDGSEPTYQAAQVNAEATGNHNSIVAVSSGGGSPHNNLQPYITCYMWKRTA